MCSYESSKQMRNIGDHKIISKYDLMLEYWLERL